MLSFVFFVQTLNKQMTLFIDSSEIEHTCIWITVVFLQTYNYKIGKVYTTLIIYKIVTKWAMALEFISANPRNHNKILEKV